MEDAHTQLLSLNNERNSAFFAVYDGHGGARVAEYAGIHLHEKIINQPAYSMNLVSLYLDSLLNSIILEDGNIPDAIKKGFLDLDQDMLEGSSLTISTMFYLI